MELTSPHRHLIPAMYNWLSENVERIHIFFILNYPGVMVRGLTENIVTVEVQRNKELPTMANFKTQVLSVGAAATNKFTFTDDGMSFQMRLNGKVQDVFIPFLAIKKMTSPDLSGMGPGFSSPFTEEELQYAVDGQPKGLLEQLTTGNDQKPVRKRDHLKLVI